MDTSTRAAPAAAPTPLYVTTRQRNTITAGLHSAAKLLDDLAERATAEQLDHLTKLLTGSAVDYRDLAQRIERGELDQVPT